MASRCGKAPPQSFLELASPKTAARTRSRTRAGARFQAARALPTALDAVSQLASTVNNQAGNPDRLNTSAHCLCFFSGGVAEGTVAVPARASKLERAGQVCSIVGRANGCVMLCVLCCLTDMVPLRPMDPEMVIGWSRWLQGPQNPL